MTYACQIHPDQTSEYPGTRCTVWTQVMTCEDCDEVIRGEQDIVKGESGALHHRKCGGFVRARTRCNRQMLPKRKPT